MVSQPVTICLLDQNINITRTLKKLLSWQFFIYETKSRLREPLMCHLFSLGPLISLQSPLLILLPFRQDSFTFPTDKTFLTNLLYQIPLVSTEELPLPHLVRCELSVFAATVAALPMLDKWK